MKLTARDKKLLIGLGIFLFIVLFGKFLFFPKIDNIRTLKNDIAALNNTYNTNMLYKTQTDNIDSDIKIFSEKLKNLRAVYPPSMDLSQLIIVLKELSTKSKLEIGTIQFQAIKQISFNGDTAASGVSGSTASDIASAGTSVEGQASGTPNLQQEQQNPEINISNSKIRNYYYQLGLKSYEFISKNSDLKEAVNIPDGKAYCISIQIDAKGTNEQIKNFFDNVNKLGTRAYCRNINISELTKGITEDTDAGHILKLSAEIVFYGIMDSGACGYYLLPEGKWMPIPPESDKENLFKEYSGYTTTNIDGSGLTNFVNSFGDKEDENTEENDEIGDYDFSVVASTFGGGLAPSVSVICKNPKEEKSYSSPVAYGDNKGVEDIEIFIEEKDGKYYCKFKTERESYPDTQYSQTFEFEPVGKDLRLYILSSKRIAKEDLAGVNINIVNNTKKVLSYRIENDDENSPRVKIGNTVGSVRNEK